MDMKLDFKKSRLFCVQKGCFRCSATSSTRHVVRLSHHAHGVVAGYLLWRPPLDHFTTFMESDIRLTKIVSGAMTDSSQLQKWEIFRVNVFTFGANAASAEDGIYLLDARTTIGPTV
jgi:hypothetical protein